MKKNNCILKYTSTRAAFKALLSIRGIYKMLGKDKNTVSNYRRYLSQGKNISLDKMEEMLLKAGAKVVKEKVWELPGSQLNKYCFHKVKF